MVREVSNEEFEAAYAAEDNRKIIKYVCNQYTRKIDADELESLGAIALWKALRTFNPTLGMSLTSFLYNQVDWECKGFLRERDKALINSIEYIPDVHSSGSIENLDFTLLDDNYRKPIEQRIIGRMSFREMAKANGRGTETERQNWLRIMQELRDEFTD